MPESHGSNQQWVASQALISYRRALALTRSAVGHVQAGLGLRECVRANARRYKRPGLGPSKQHPFGRERAENGGPGLFNALSERDGAGGAVKDVFLLSERSPV